jgi:arylsulfatase A-like enzyme
MAQLPAQDVVIELCSDGLSVADIPKTLAELLKSIGYNHALFTSAHGARPSEVN